MTQLVTFSERSRSILGGWSTITAEQTTANSLGDGAEGAARGDAHGQIGHSNSFAAGHPRKGSGCRLGRLGHLHAVLGRYQRRLCAAPVAPHWLSCPWRAGMADRLRQLRHSRRRHRRSPPAQRARLGLVRGRPHQRRGRIRPGLRRLRAPWPAGTAAGRAGAGLAGILALVHRLPADHHLPAAAVSRRAAAIATLAAGRLGGSGRHGRLHRVGSLRAAAVGGPARDRDAAESLGRRACRGAVSGAGSHRRPCPDCPRSPVPGLTGAAVSAIAGGAAPAAEVGSPMPCCWSWGCGCSSALPV